MTSACCQSCGHPLLDKQQAAWDRVSRTFSTAKGSVRFVALEAAFFDVMFRHRNRGALHEARDVLAAVYADDAEGGPENTGIVRVTIHDIRRKIEPKGWTITRNTGAPRQGYRLAALA